MKHEKIDDGVLVVRHRGLLTATLMLTVVIQTLDITIANVAIPEMQGSLSATREQIAWVLTSYVVATAIATPLTGFLAERFGRRPLFVAVIVGFTLASMACGAAGSLTEIVACRILQGAFGAAMAPLTQALMLDLYSLRERAQVMSLFGVGVMIGPVLGPSLGSYLTDAWSWRAVFYVNAPFGILAVLGALAYLPGGDRRAGASFDAFGFGLLGLAIGALQLLLDRGEARGWLASSEIAAELVLTGLSLYLFVVHILTGRAPFLRPAMFRDRNFTAGLILVLAFGATTLATMTLMPPFLSELLGYPTLDIGIALVPRGIGTTIAMLVAGKVINRFDARLLIVFGMGCVAVSLWGMAGFDLAMDAQPIVWTGLVQGFGLGLIFMTLSVASFTTLRPHLRTDASALFTLARNIGGSFGVAMVMSVLADDTQASHALLAAHITPFNQALQASRLAPYWTIDTQAGLIALNQEVTRQAGMIAFLNDFRLMTLVCLASMPLALLLRPAKP